MVQIYYILINFYSLIIPINLNYLWNIGSLLSLALFLQIIAGIIFNIYWFFSWSKDRNTIRTLHKIIFHLGLFLFVGYNYIYCGIPIAYAMDPMDGWENLGFDIDQDDQEILIEEDLDEEENVPEHLHQEDLPDPAGPEVLPGSWHEDSECDEDYFPVPTNVDPSADEVKTCWEKVKSCFGF